MNKLSLSVLFLASALVAQSPEIYSNGPLQTGVGTQGPISVLQSLAPNSLTVFGFGAQSTVPNRCIDQFAVNTLMVLDGIEVFGYLTGGTAPSCTAIQLSLFDGDPRTGTPNQVLPGAGDGVNLIGAPGYTVTNTLTGIYRVLDTAAGLPATNRNIQSVRTDFAPITLQPGIYYLSFAYAGISFCPPVTTLNQQVTGDGFQYLQAPAAPQLPGFYPAVSGAVPGFGQAMPFKLYGTQITPPGAITNLGGGCSTAAFSVQGSPAVGGYVRAELSSVNAQALGLIVVGLSDPNAPLFVCACTSHASLDVVNPAGGFGAPLAYSLQIPANASLVGFDIFLQGGTIDIVPFGGITSCNLGAQFDLTDGFRVHLY